MDTENKIHDAIVKLVADVTFTPDALKMMQDALIKVKDLEYNIDSLIDAKKRLDFNISQREDLIIAREKTIAEKIAIISEYNKREEDLKIRERFANQNEQSAAVGTAEPSAKTT